MKRIFRFRRVQEGEMNATIQDIVGKIISQNADFYRYAQNVNGSFLSKNRKLTLILTKKILFQKF